MRAGTLTHPVTVQQPDPAATGDGMGTVDLSVPANWATYAMRRAKVEPLVGREYWFSKQSQTESTHMVTMWRDAVTAAITTRMRILWLTLTLNIVDIQDQGPSSLKIMFRCKAAA